MVIVYGISKVCSAVIVRKISATMIEGISIGMVICQNCCHLEAPSTSAASYSDFGIICSPASRINAMKELVFQMIVRQIAAKAQFGRSSHMFGSLAPSRRITSLTTPYSVWKNHAKIRPANASGSAQGSSRARRTGHLRLNGRLANIASPRPTTRAPGTVISVISTVFFAAFQKSGSLKTST